MKIWYWRLVHVTIMQELEEYFKMYWETLSKSLGCMTFTFSIRFLSISLSLYPFYLLSLSLLSAVLRICCWLIYNFFTTESYGSSPHVLTLTFFVNENLKCLKIQICTSPTTEPNNSLNFFYALCFSLMN